MLEPTLNTLLADLRELVQTARARAAIKELDFIITYGINTVWDAMQRKQTKCEYYGH